MNKSKPGYAWLGIALVLFLLQALPFLSYRWVTDESWYAGPGYSIAQGNGIKDPAIGPNDLENHFDARPPGTAIVIAGFMKLLGPNQMAARMGSVLAGLTIVLLTYGLTRDMFGQEGAVIATLLAATDNLIVLTARTARPEALTTMAVLLSLWAMKQYARKHSAAWPFLAGLLIAMGTMFHITVLGYILSFGVLALAIDRKYGRFPLLGTLSYTSGFAFGLVPFVTWILTAAQGREGFHAEFLSRAIQTSALVRFVQEQRRYADLLGLKMLHGHGLESIPVRLPIPLLFLVATYLLWRFRRSWFYLELLLLLPTALWLVYTVNKSSRYLALLAPLFAMAIGAAVSASRGRRPLHMAMRTAAILAIVAQTGANVLLLNSARHANYSALGAKLRSVIPPSATAYGTITFWLALHDRTFISYERTEPFMAASTYNARYFILGDRMMTNADVFGDQAFYNDLNQQLDQLVTRSELVGNFPDPYYGDLKVYWLHD